MKAERGLTKQTQGLNTPPRLRHLTWPVTSICHFVSRLAKLFGCEEASQCPVVRIFGVRCLSLNSKNVVKFDRHVVFSLNCARVLK